MPPENPFFLPFTNRKQLAFEHGATFAIDVQFQATRVGTLIIRGMTREGVFAFRIVTTSDGIINGDTFNVPDIPIFVSVFDADQAFKQGECYVQVRLISQGDVLLNLGSGLVSALRAIGWPNVVQEDARPGGGAIKSITGTNPAAGAEVSQVVPDGRVWRLLSLRVTLVATAAAASRRVHLQIGDGTNVLLDCFGSIDQIISETKTYNFSAVGVIPDETDSNEIIVPIPPYLMLPDNFTIATLTTAINAADDFGAPQLLVEEYFTPAT